MQSVYLETSVIGHLTSRISLDLVTAGHQQSTITWWKEHRQQYDLFISEPVISELAAGNPTMAAERLDAVAGISVLKETDEVTALSIRLVHAVPLPEKAVVDALHIALASYHGIDYLLTWNCRHIANANTMDRIRDICKAEGHFASRIVTVEQLIANHDGEVL